MEYAKSIYDYDRQELSDYQDTLAELKQQKEDLETAKEELLAAEQTKQEQKSKADSLVAAQQEKNKRSKVGCSRCRDGNSRHRCGNRKTESL